MNDVKLQEGHPVDENLRPIKVGGKSTAIETAQHGNGARINGDLEVTGDITGNIKDMVLEDVTLDSLIIDKDITSTVADSEIMGIHIDLDKTGATTSNNTMYGIRVQGNNTTAVDGLNSIIGVSSIVTLTHAADAGVTGVRGGDFLATGSTNGAFGLNEAYGIVVNAAESDKNIGGQFGVNSANTNIGLDVRVGLGTGSSDGSDTGIVMTCKDHADNLDLHIRSSADTGDYFAISTIGAGATTMRTVDDDGENADLTFNIDGFIDMNSATGEDITLDSGGDIILDSATGVFVMKGAGTTSEFSVANSAYAGMILGYTTVGIDATSDSHTLVAATMTVVDDAMKVKFVAPPSGVVEIFVSIYGDFGRRQPVFGLSDQDTGDTYQAISFPNATDVTNEHILRLPPSSGGDTMLRNYWVVTGLTAGTAYEWWFAAKTSLGVGGVLRWGGTATNQYPPFIMKATALPTAVTDFAVYD